MEENRAENIHDSMKYSCRVCAAVTCNKKIKPDESVGIFKRPGLKSILERYLHLQISEDDPLPKVICRSCFDKLGIIENLRITAKRTENLLRDYLKNQESPAQVSGQFQNVYNSFAISKNSAKVDEVVLNVSLSDPLSKNIDKKLMFAQRKKESLEKAFTPAQISRNALTSSPNLQPVTVVHQMPRKKVSTTLVEKRKSLQMALSNATTVTLEKAPPPSGGVPSNSKLQIRPKATTVPPPLRHISDAPSIQQKVEIHPVITANTHNLSKSITLGSIIKDEDLVRLILKALKWPVNNQTLDIQIQRLKNTKFSDVIVDPNLLQDTDLIQILGPLINPNLVQVPAPAQPPTYHITLPPENIGLPSTTIAYKLPAETSVQIITVPPEENASSKPRDAPKQLPPIVRPVFKKKPRPISLPRKKNVDVIIVSDESDEESMKELRSNEDVQRFEVHLDPAMYPGVGDNSNSNEAMLAKLNRQREAMMRMHRNKRKQSIISQNMEMVDDIMIVDEGVQLIEPYPEVVLVKKPRKPQSVPPPMPSPSTSLNIIPVESQKKPSVQPILTKFSNLPAMGSKKIPALLTKVKKPMPQLSITNLREPVKKTIPPAPSKPNASSLYNMKNTTLADADSTTKIVIKESKVPKSQQASLDIEEQISKVRIGKQTIQSPVNVANESEKEKTAAKGTNQEILVFVECDGEQSGSKIINEKEKSAVVASSKDELKLEEGRTSEKKNDEQAASPIDPIAVELTSIEIKTEPDGENSKFDAESTNDDRTSSSEKKDDDDSESVRSGKVLSQSSSKTDSKVRSRPGRKRKLDIRKDQTKVIASTTYRPARRSKTLSKYYKGPPVADSGRSMRSRT